MKERIGFIGVGLMGHGMAKNIVEKGWPLTVLARRKREAVDDLKSRGAKEAASPRAVADASDIVVLCVTGSPQVEAIVEGPDGLASAGKPLMIVDCSTSEPASTRRLAADARAEGDCADRRAAEPHPQGRLGRHARRDGRRRPRGGRSAPGRCSKPSPAASSTPGRSEPATR